MCAGTLALTNGGRLFSWGRCASSAVHARCALLYSRRVMEVNYACILTRQRLARSSSDGRLGNGVNGNCCVPTPLQGLEGHRVLSASFCGMQGMAVTDQNQVFRWGRFAERASTAIKTPQAIPELADKGITRVRWLRQRLIHSRSFRFIQTPTSDPTLCCMSANADASCSPLGSCSVADPILLTAVCRSLVALWLA